MVRSRGLITSQEAVGATVMPPPEQERVREALAYVQSFGLKASAVVFLRFINSRSSGFPDGRFAFDLGVEL